MDAILLRLARYYQIEIPGADVLEMYHQALDSYSVEQIADAATKHVKESKWFPKICELLDILKPKPKGYLDYRKAQGAIEYADPKRLN